MRITRVMDVALLELNCSQARPVRCATPMSADLAALCIPGISADYQQLSAILGTGKVSSRDKQSARKQRLDFLQVHRARDSHMFSPSLRRGCCPKSTRALYSTFADSRYAISRPSRRAVPARISPTSNVAPRSSVSNESGAAAIF